MDQIFFLKLFHSFLIGGVRVIGITLFADKFGTKIGGTISGLPSTVLFSLLFIAWTQSPAVAVATTTILPASGGIVTLFMASYIIFVKKGVWIALLAASIVWSILSFGLIEIGIHNFGYSLLIYVLLLLIACFFVQRRHVPTVSGKKIVYTPVLIFFRGLLSGVIVALAVFIAKVSGPTLGGMFTIFPAATISIMLITYFEHGATFSAAMVKSILFSMSSVIIYAIIVRYTYIPTGIIWGTLLATLGSIITVWLLFHSLIKRTH